jgi:hypothetical protein
MQLDNADNAISAPSRKLDEFEELVYEYTGRMGMGNEDVPVLWIEIGVS